MSVPNYTFGDTGEASVRLRRLAELYEPETKALLEHGAVRSPRVAADLGCGPGWSTRLLHVTLQPLRTIGLDASERFIGEARQNYGPSLEFRVHDLVRDSFYVSPDVLLCRFLLTHLSPIGEALAAWAGAAAPQALLFIHETESLETDVPALDRYYQLVAELQAHYKQTLYVGGLLEAFVEQRGWKIVESERLILEKPAQKMAELHVSNLRTWRNEEYAKKSFDPRELASLEASLASIAAGEEVGQGNGGIVVNAARQIIARRA